MRSCYLQTQTVQLMKLKQNMFTKIFMRIKIYLILVISQDSKFFNPVNKKVIGKMKDEFKGKMISEFVGLKTKMYSLIYVDSKENKKAKGVNKNIVKTLRLKDFFDVLFN